MEGAKMADKKGDKGPYTVMARHIAGGTEQRIGTFDSLDEATEQADGAVDAGLWADANVYDREQRHVHAAVKQTAARVDTPEDSPPPAA